MTERLKYFDLLRSIAIIGVIAIHSTGIGYTFQNTSINFNVTVLWRQIINFSVPMFIAISGYFLANKNINSKENHLSFLQKQIPRVFIPYVIWSVLYLGISFIKGTDINELLYRFLTFQSSTPFYFIILIIEYYLLLPIIQKLASKQGLIISALISILSCLLIFYTRYYTHSPTPPYIIYSAPSWLFFFVLGTYLRNNEIKLKNSTILSCLTFGLLLSLTETYALYYSFKSIENAVTAVKISSFIYSAFFILLAFKNANKNISNMFLEYIGKISFGIYLSHMFFMIVANVLIKNLFKTNSQNAIVIQLTFIMAVLSMSTIFATLTRKANKKSALKYLGQ